jgi:hypothetical protein
LARDFQIKPRKEQSRGEGVKKISVERERERRWGGDATHGKVEKRDGCTFFSKGGKGKKGKKKKLKWSAVCKRLAWQMGESRWGDKIWG